MFTVDKNCAMDGMENERTLKRFPRNYEFENIPSVRVFLHRDAGKNRPIFLTLHFHRFGGAKLL